MIICITWKDDKDILEWKVLTTFNIDQLQKTILNLPIFSATKKDPVDSVRTPDFWSPQSIPDPSMKNIF